MATTSNRAESVAASTPGGKPNSRRPNACTECQRRKIKCDHEQPCSNCIRLKLNCMPSVPQIRRRRRKFPEKVLLDRLRHYESLLAKTRVSFQPFEEGAEGEGDGRSVIDDDEDAEEERVLKTEGEGVSKDTPESLDAVNLWSAMNQKAAENDSDDGNGATGHNHHKATPRADDITHLPTLQKALDQVYNNQDTKLLYCEPSGGTLIDITAFHPTHGQIFQLWQIYLDNVDPLLKVTHTPTMQGKIINAMTNLAAVDTVMHALLLGIYCVAVTSMSNEDCMNRCGAPKKDLLNTYHLGCQQAIWRCNFMRTNDRDVLTAVLLYLISIKRDVDHRSLSTLLGTVIRIAQRIGIDSEAQNSKYDAFEAEMRRRLWWALVLFDRRVCEASHDLRLSALTPTWSCQLPANLNDFELRPGMKSLPQAHDRPTEALHIIVRSTIGQRLRYSPSQMDFVNPMLRSLAKMPNNSAEHGDDLAVLENLIAAKSFSDYNLEDPLQYITMWSARSALANARLWKHYWSVLRAGERQKEAQRDAAMSHALAIIECEANLSTSPLAKNYRWYISHFPFAAYIHVIQELKIRPLQRLTKRAWTVLNEDFMTRFEGASLRGHPIFVLLAKTFLQAWEAREVASGSWSNDRPTAPAIMEEMRRIAEPEVPVSMQDPLMQPQGGSNDNPFGNFGLEDFLPVPADFYGDASNDLFDVSWPDAGGVGTGDMDMLGLGGTELAHGFGGGVQPC